MASLNATFLFFTEPLSLCPPSDLAADPDTVTLFFDYGGDYRDDNCKQHGQRWKLENKLYS